MIEKLYSFIKKVPKSALSHLEIQASPVRLNVFGERNRIVYGPFQNNNQLNAVEKCTQFYNNPLSLSLSQQAALRFKTPIKTIQYISNQELNLLFNYLLLRAKEENPTVSFLALILLLAAILLLQKEVMAEEKKQNVVSENTKTDRSISGFNIDKFLDYFSLPLVLDYIEFL